MQNEFKGIHECSRNQVLQDLLKQSLKSPINDVNNLNDPGKSQKALRALEQEIIESLINNEKKDVKQTKKQVHFEKCSSSFSFEVTNGLEKDTLSKSSKAHCPYCNHEVEVDAMEAHKDKCSH